MKTKNFSFNIPEELIAQHPVEKGQSRVLVVDRRAQNITHDKFTSIVDRLPAESVLVLNNTRVRKARLFGISPDGGKVEFLLIDQKSRNHWDTIVSRAKRQRVGKRYSFPEGINGEISAVKGSIREVLFSEVITDSYLEKHGQIPLPPYIKREPEADDDHYYQTIFAGPEGSVAAPTAGLHFTENILEQIKERGIHVAYVTLHVGIGTFLPIRTENIEDHIMHEEIYSISPETAELINTTKKKSLPVVAVGTTTVRTLESAYRNGELQAGTDATDLYIYPGYSFSAVDGIITNFHTSESSLFVMISAFTGLDLLKHAYQEGVERKYRFFSYGDAMYIPP